MADFEVITDGAGFAFLPYPVAAGERVTVKLRYRGVGDEGVPSSIHKSYPLDVKYNLIGVSNERQIPKKFDYESCKLAVEDGIIVVSFDVPKDIVVLELKFSVNMTGGSLYGETADRDWATLADKLDDKTQLIQVKMLVKV